MPNTDNYLTGIAYWSAQSNSVMLRILELSANSLSINDYQMPDQSSQPILDFMRTPVLVDVPTDNQYVTDFLTDSHDGVMDHRYIFMGDAFIQPTFKLIRYTDSVNTLRQYFDQQVNHP